MNADPRRDHDTPSARDRLPDSHLRVRIGGATKTATELLTAGREFWRRSRPWRLPALLGVEGSDMLSLLTAAMADARTVLLSNSDSDAPACCDARIGPGGQEAGAFAPRAVDVPSSEAVEIPGGLAVLSSGTLGTPKIVWHRPEAILATAGRVVERLRLSASDRVLITVPLHHMYGLGAALVPAWLAGAEIQVLSRANLVNFNDALRDFDPTLVYSTPHLLRTLLRRKREPLRSCRAVVLAGDGIPPPLHAQARQVFNEVFDLYGSTELGVVAISEPEHGRLRPLDGVRVSAAEVDGDKTCLLVEHPFPASHLTQASRSLPFPERWDTRDIASFAPDGTFQVHGRADLSVNRAGKLLVLAELERIAMSWPGVDLAVALALDDDSTAGKAVLLLVRASAPGMTVETLRDHAARELPVFARPDRYRIVAELPCLPSGKPDRKVIAEEYRHE